MAYAVKYRITQATLLGATTVIDMLEDAYAGDIIEYQATGIQLQYIPSSDDPFEPIYASQLNIGIDVTNNAANMPDFTVINDRKYLIKYYSDASLKWQGWALSDNVQYLFSTGFKELRFNAICGLGMLERIEFSTAETGYRITLLKYLQESLLPLNFPTQPTLLSSCSIYSATMSDREDDPKSEPWDQCYMAVNNFTQTLTDDQGVTRNKFTCLGVLRDILKSWGCRIFMDNGEWNIFQVNQQAATIRYWTRYSLTTGYIESGTFGAGKNIPNDAIFVEGTQLKIYKKGFNNFFGLKKIQFPDNMLFNANLKQITGGNADFWTTTTGGTGYIAIREGQERDINAYILALGDVTTGALAQIDSNTPIPINVGDQPKIQFRIYNTTANLDGSGNLLPNCLLKITISGASSTVYLSDTNEWKTLTLTTTDFYKVNDKKSNTLVNLEEIPNAPIDGTLYFGALIQGSGVNTQSALIIGDFEVTQVSTFKSVLITSEIDNTESYRTEVVFPHGYNIQVTSNFNRKPSYYGAITDIDGNQLYGWYMMERKLIDNYFSLAELMFQNYINMLRENIINIDSSIYGLLSATDVYTFTDIDPSQISVQGKKYLIGNTTFDSQRNELIGTALQISNTHQDATVTITYDNGIGSGISFTMSSSAAISSSAACLFTTYPLTVYSNTFLPVVGDIIYSDVDLTATWAGSNVWWKVFIPYFNTTRSYKISNVGVITDVSTC